MDVLLQIKRLVVRGWIRFTEKAREEMEADGLGAAEVEDRHIRRVIARG